jgi:predicted ATPase/DNA-binding winged helix-turn-helix (wHTH) protein
MHTANVTTRQGSTAAMVPFSAARGHVQAGQLKQTDNSSSSERCFSFGPYRLFPRQRLLLRDGKPVQIGGRSLEILIALAERQGDVVGKRELMSLVWPGITVEEGALRVQIVGLRKALGDGVDGACYIKTFAGRGYCLVATASREPAGESSAATAGADHAPRLPSQLDQVIGLADSVRKISDLLETRRFVTIHGPGGIGKTTAAVAVANSQLAAFAGEVHLLDLGRIAEPHRLPGALASALGVSVESGDPTLDLLEFLRDRRMLLIFDSCEHLIEPAAALIEKIFHTAAQVSILATSREMLRVDGEHVYRLAGLGCPVDGDEQSAERMLSFAAPRLFVNRVAASGCRLELTDADASIVARICRKLDGVALAINVVAARAETFGLSEIAHSLETRSWLLWRGHRTALPRHQTIEATVDWSYGLLNEAEQAVLRHLSVFKGFFTLGAARQIARHGAPDLSDDLSIIDKLVAKSLISFESGDGSARYRLLNATRAYALEKLRDRGEFDAIAAKAREYSFAGPSQANQIAEASA